MTMQADQPAPILTGDATPVATEAQRIAAIEAKFKELGPPKELIDQDGPADEPNDMVDEVDQPTTEPETPAAKAVRPLDGLDEDADPDADIDQIAEAQREIVRQRRERAKERDEFRAFQEERAQFAREKAEWAEFKKRFSDPGSFLELYEQAGGDPTKLGEYVVSAQDPARRATESARRELDPIRKQLEEANNRIASFEQERAVAAAMREVSGRIGELAADTTQASTVSHSAAMLKNDADHFWETYDAECLKLAQRVDGFGRPLRFTWDHAIKETEKRLAREAARFGAHQPLSANGTPPAQTPATKPTNGKAPPKNVTQRSAGGRTMIAEEPDYSLLSPKERAAHLERHYREREKLGR